MPSRSLAEGRACDRRKQHPGTNRQHISCIPKQIPNTGCFKSRITLSNPETLKIADDWANGDESMSSCCTVTTEPYDKDNAGEQSAEVSEDWPFEGYQKPENCEIGEIEDWGSSKKVYVTWESKDAAKAYKEVLALSGGTTADIDGAFEYNSGEVMISYSETDELANFIMIYE